jgi:hypothetical protein
LHHRQTNEANCTRECSLFKVNGELSATLRTEGAVAKKAHPRDLAKTTEAELAHLFSQRQRGVRALVRDVIVPKLVAAHSGRQGC